MVAQSYSPDFHRRLVLDLLYYRYTRLISETALHTRPPPWPGLASQVPIMTGDCIPQFEWDIAKQC